MTMRSSLTYPLSLTLALFLSPFVAASAAETSSDSDEGPFGNCTGLVDAWCYSKVCSPSGSNCSEGQCIVYYGPGTTWTNACGIP